MFIVLFFQYVNNLVVFKSNKKTNNLLIRILPEMAHGIHCQFPIETGIMGLIGVVLMSNSTLLSHLQVLFLEKKAAVLAQLKSKIQALQKHEFKMCPPQSRNIVINLRLYELLVFKKKT